MPHNIYYEKELKSPSLIICITIAPKGINLTANTSRAWSAQKSKSRAMKRKQQHRNKRIHVVQEAQGDGLVSRKTMSSAIKLPVHNPAKEGF